MRYDAVNAMLLNEFLKEHNKVERLEATVSRLAVKVKEKAALIQNPETAINAFDIALRWLVYTDRLTNTLILSHLISPAFS